MYLYIFCLFISLIKLFIVHVYVSMSGWEKIKGSKEAEEWKIHTEVLFNVDWRAWSLERKASWTDSSTVKRVKREREIKYTIF